MNRFRAAGELVVANLEGPVTSKVEHYLARKLVFNHPAAVDYLSAIGAGVVSLANNHMMDVPDALTPTITRLRASNLSPVGAGMHAASANAPVVVHENGRQRVFLAFGWTVNGCRPAGPRTSGVSVLTPDNVLGAVESARRAYPLATIVLLMHWNYELELFPQPLHRELAFRAIDLGANAVVGCHPHCIQGIENYRGAPIVYSLGNWFFPHGQFFGGRLRFPPISLRQLAFQWDPETAASVCHWYSYDPSDHRVELVGSEPTDESSSVADSTPFAGMEAREYRKWFRRHRRKRQLLPVYHDPDGWLSNAIRDRWVGLRQKLVDAAFATGLKGGPR